VILGGARRFAAAIIGPHEHLFPASASRIFFDVEHPYDSISPEALLFFPFTLPNDVRRN